MKVKVILALIALGLAEGHKLIVNDEVDDLLDKQDEKDA